MRGTDARRADVDGESLKHHMRVASGCKHHWRPWHTDSRLDASTFPFGRPQSPFGPAFTSLWSPLELTLPNLFPRFLMPRVREILSDSRCWA